MNRAGAEAAVTTSAVVVVVVFAYRKLVESSVSTSTVPQTGHFVLGFMVVFVSLSVVAMAAPELGAMFAILVAIGDLLTNGQQITQDINTGLQTTQKATGSTETFATFTPTTTAA